MKPLFKYFGSKYRLSAHLPPPRGRHIVETFAGAAGYATHYGADRSVVLLDADPRIVGLWQGLITARPEDVLSIPYDLPVGLDLTAWGIEHGRPPWHAELVIRWQRVGRGGCSTVSKWNNSMQGFWSHAIRQRVADSLPLIRRWSAHCTTWEPFDVRGCTVVVDPPYQHIAPSCYSARFSQWAELGQWCRGIAQHNDVIAHEAPGADWLPFKEWQRPRRASPNSRSREQTTELLWIG